MSRESVPPKFVVGSHAPSPRPRSLLITPRHLCFSTSMKKALAVCLMPATWKALDFWDRRATPPRSWSLSSEIPQGHSVKYRRQSLQAATVKYLDRIWSHFLVKVVGLEVLLQLDANIRPLLQQAIIGTLLSDVTEQIKTRCPVNPADFFTHEEYEDRVGSDTYKLHTDMDDRLGIW